MKIFSLALGILLTTSVLPRADDVLSQPTYHATKSGDRLTVDLADGSTLTFNDENFPNVKGKKLEYTFDKYFEEIDYVALNVCAYRCEEYKCLLINRKTGEKFTVDYPPLISPNVTRFVTVPDVIPSSEKNSREIQIWEITESSITLEWAYEPNGWVPMNANWLDDETVRVEKQNFDLKGKSNLGTVLFVKTDKTWILEE